MADIHEGDRVLDLFCGIGTVGMAVSPADAELFGIEIVESAVMNARRNAELNGFTRAAFACCDADDPDAVRKALEPFRGSLDVVLTDPPRGGCDQSLIDIIAGLDAKRIVYISCNPNTLARDLVIFREKGSCSGMGSAGGYVSEDRACGDGMLDVKEFGLIFEKRKGLITNPATRPFGTVVGSGIDVKGNSGKS